jgi:hypothetical protein
MGLSLRESNLNAELTGQTRFDASLKFTDNYLSNVCSRLLEKTRCIHLFMKAYTTFLIYQALIPGTSRMRIKAQPIMLEEQLLDQHGFYFNIVFAIVPSG